MAELIRREVWSESGRCPTCGTVTLSGPPHVCEGGVTPPFSMGGTFVFRHTEEEWNELPWVRFMKREQQEGEAEDDGQP